MLYAIVSTGLCEYEIDAKKDFFFFLVKISQLNVQNVALDRRRPVSQYCVKRIRPLALFWACGCLE